MRLTIGPLPPAVYWRRRAVVLGAGLLFLLVIIYSCSQPGDRERGAQNQPTAPAGGQTSPTILTPSSGDPEATAPPDEDPNGAPDVGDPGAGGPGTETDPVIPAGGDVPANPGTVPDVAAPPSGACTDAEISVVPVPADKSAQRGATLGLQLKIRNISNRSCARDLGADFQELFIKVGAETIWSSDKCGTAKGSDVRTLPPNVDFTYRADWNGNLASKCADGLATGPDAEPGDYQVFGRLGTKLSEPVKLTITA